MLRILANLVIMSGEAAAVAAVAWAGYHFPFAFAGLTALLALVLGGRLEQARMLNELPFYFGVAGARRRVVVTLVAAGETVMKALLAGLAALLTFAGTDRPRLLLIAVLFGLITYAGTNVLRVLSLRLDARPERWGYFRLAAPLGLLFSLGISVLGEVGLVAPPSLGDLGSRLLFEMPARPTIAQASELLFSVKLYFDQVIVGLLGAVMGKGAASVVGLLLSVNVLTGFVVALYAVVVADGVRRLERAWL